MFSSSQDSSGSEGRFILAIVLIGVIWLGWQSYLDKKYPPHQKALPAATEQMATEQQANNVSNTATNSNADKKGAAATSPVVPEKTLNYSDSTWNFQISSIGMAIRNVQLNKYTNRHNKNIEFATGNDFGLFSTSLVNQSEPIHFDVRQEAPNIFVGDSKIGTMEVTKRIEVDSKNFTFKTTVDVHNPSADFAGVITKITDIIPPAVSGFFAARFNHQEFFVNHGGSLSRTIITPSKQVNESYSKAVIAGYGSQYFAVGYVDESPIMPNLHFWSLEGTTPTAVADFKYDMPNRTDDYKVQYTGFAGPKSFDLLKSINPDLTGLINFGFFTTIAKGIFWLMKMIHNVIGNWGLAIIVLTLIVRAIVAPFNIISYRQMRAMARIQPQIKALKERYKDDSQRLNQEMLALMRENKANPLGGCLPMFLQIPVFFALYEVIGQSIELYKAPFVFWIHDLSAKDPFYVIPVLMGAAMFAQQKITPNTMDPSQQKIMLFMPVIFMVMCVSLPSGLNLYIFVSSLFGVLQQYFFTREKKQLSVVQA